MRYLLDTNVLLRAAAGDASRKVRDTISDKANDLYYSTVSIWEIIIKTGLGREDFRVDVYELIDRLKTAGYLRLDIKEDHILGVASLANHHKDPFDRLLIAQAARERMSLLTADRVMEMYGITCAER